MAVTLDNEIEAKARALLQETIERSGWYPSLRRIEREKRITQDVDLHWHLMVPEARSGWSRAEEAKKRYRHRREGLKHHLTVRTRDCPMRLLVLCTFFAVLPLAAVAEELGGIQPGSGWNCTAAAPGLPRVCGSRHETYTPPKVITQTIEVERPVPVPVPVYEPPIVQYVPVPVYVPKPVYRPSPTEHRPRSPYTDHGPHRRF